MAQKKKGTSLPNAKQLREKNADELKTMLAEKRDELMRARFKHATASLENTAFLSAAKRQIARIQTILKQKEMES